jgi:hypothetical protein
VTLMTVVAVGYLADAITVVVGAAAYPDRVRAAFNASEVNSAAFDTLKPLISALPYVAAVVTAVAALVLLGLAASVRAGHFAGRIIAWVAIGLSLTCNLCGLGAAGTPAFSGIAYVSAYDRDASGTHTFAQRLPQAYPPAYRYLSGGFAVFAMLALIVVIVLLALPSANRFFRPAAQLAPMPAFYQQGYPAFYQQGYPVPPPRVATVSSTAERNADLSVLMRKHQRGELTDEEFAAARERLIGNS